MRKWKLNLKLINIQQNASSYSGNIWKVVIIIIIIVTVIIEVILKMLVMYMDKDNNKEQYF